MSITPFANRKGCEEATNHIILHKVTSENGNRKRHIEVRTQGTKKKRKSDRCDHQARCEEAST